MRASLGTWLPFVGPFGYLDLTGLAAYAPIMRDLFPDLSSSHAVPDAMQKVMKRGAQGISNGRGFYVCEGNEGAQKRQDFDDFRRDLSTLIARYEAKRKSGKNKTRAAKKR